MWLLGAFAIASYHPAKKMPSVTTLNETAVLDAEARGAFKPRWSFNWSSDLRNFLILASPGVLIGILLTFTFGNRPAKAASKDKNKETTDLTP